GNLEDSIKYLQKSIDLGLEIKGGQILWEAYLEMGNAYRKEKEYEKALESYKNSINIIEDIRSKIKLEELKASYFGTDRRLEAFHNLIDLLARLHQSHSGKEYDLQAFNYMERAKARSFLDSLEVSNIDISAGVDLRLIEREKELMQEISKIYKTLLSPDLTEEKRNELYSQLKKHEEEIESVKREIRISSPAYADLKYPQIISVKEAQKKLADRTTAFFEYCLGRENSYAFVITRKKLKIFSLPPAREIQKKVKNYLGLITDRECSEFQPGYELFSSLILPGLDKKIRKIIISPDDILHFLPFEALITQQSPKRWLIEDYRVSYIPSLSVLSEIKNHKKMKKQRPKKDLIAFGDPSFGVNEITNSEKDIFQDYYSSNTFNFFRLEHSSQEVERIGSLFKKSKKSIYRRENASEELIKKIPLSQYKILHFATHALVDEKNPARSAIVLSLKNNDNEDGFLQMREIFNLDLNCDLVTLSACQTGLGEFIRGEGIESLNRAFFYAGSSSALITLWAVNDQASAILMERFYSHLRHSFSIMEALRKAKLEMISSGNLSHPYFWAGYLATGMADRIIFPSSSKKLFILLSLFLTGAGIITFRNLHRKM
ncbi:MAG: CHAT domain-containing protein, partial [Candidatus Hydrothermarchaeota archaeon]